MKYAGVLICVTDGAFLFAGEGDGRPTLAIPALAFKCFGSVPDARNNPPLSVNTRTWFQPSELWIFPLKKKKRGKKKSILFYLFLCRLRQPSWHSPGRAGRYTGLLAPLCCSSSPGCCVLNTTGLLGYVHLSWFPLQ